MEGGNRFYFKTNTNPKFSENKMIKFSIITVCYNSENLIEETIKSVLNQKYKNFEYIIVDGGSSDNTLNIIKEYKEDVDVVVSESDRGIYDAMNKGLKLANGQFVNFLNAGDSFCSIDTLGLVEDKIKTETKIISGDFNLINFNKGIKKKIKTKKLNIENLKRDFKACHQAIFINHEIAPNYDKSFKIRADYLWVIESVLKVTDRQIEKINIPIIDYMQEGSSFNSFWKSLYELIVIQKNKFNYQIILNIDNYILRIIRNYKNEVFKKNS
jgi:glycosyltransferase involved in cell wall biosynthesis